MNVWRTLVILAALADTSSALRWESCAPMPTARMDAASAVIGDTLYVMGGRRRGGGGSGAGDQGIVNVVEAYFPAGDRWIEGFPNLPEQLADMACAVIGERIFLFGGTTANNTVVNSVWSWSPGDESWRVHTDTLPTPLRGAASVSPDGESALVMGGSEVQGGYLGSVYRFRPTSGFSVESPLLQARSSAGAGIVAGDLAITGGYFHGPLGSTEVLQEEGWGQGPALPSPRGSGLVCRDGSSLFHLGGQGTGAPLQDVLTLASPTSEWGLLDPMITARARLAGGAVGGYLVAAGGTGPVGYEATGSCERASLATLTSPDGEPIHASDLSVRVWPNPFSTHVEIMADLKVATPWHVVIHGEDGRRVGQWTGSSTVVRVRLAPTDHLPSGLYLVTMMSGGRQTTLPLLRMR
ncbi:MAG: hypothetical protein MUE60_16480 [Candidatus Eisenbacteria bacterium]|nr:hypothetical protein [Candidatus Eisenbacteria bacterium]